MDRFLPTIAVTGATGSQGGGLVRAILSDPEPCFHARAITRNPDSGAARELAELGAEVVYADLDDAGSLVDAFRGVNGAFCVTNFWEHFSPERELAQAANLAEACAWAGVPHVVWSTLEDTRTFMSLDDPRMPTIDGRWKVAHFDAKGEANAAFVTALLPTTYLHTSFYWDNMISFGMGPVENDDGELVLALPLGDAPLPGIAAADIGRCAYGLFTDPSTIGKCVGISGGHPTGAEMAAGLSAALHRDVTYVAVDPDDYRALGFPGAEDLGNMFQFNTEFSEAYCARRPVAGSRALYPGLHSYEQWLVENQWAVNPASMTTVEPVVY